ncbi:MAG: radical SAM protein [Treponema sp.]|jgi:hypothetical protein|nr:radical SAM protein [Treponema sp.]
MTCDNPNIVQNKELIDFCSRHRHVFLFGSAEDQFLTAKYLRFCGVSPEGYLVEDTDKAKPWTAAMKVFSVKEAAGKYDPAKSGVIIGVPDDEYNDAFGALRKNGFMDQHFISEHNKRTIPHKMRPRNRERFWLEVNLADHCNLNCQMCDHFSPIAEETFLDYDRYARDIKRLAELTDNHIGIMKLQGGEPLLNDRVIDFVRITREVFPRTRIFFFTDGLLLKKWENHPRGNLWNAFKEYGVEIQLTVYPINLNSGAIKETAGRYGVKIDLFTEVGDRNFVSQKRSVKHPFDLRAKQDAYEFISCYQFNESMTMRDGKIYTCPMIPYIHHFNKRFHQNLKVTPEDYIDIYKASSYEEIAEFVTRRVPFCGYCAVSKRSAHPWKQSKNSIDEWILTPEDLNMKTNSPPRRLVYSLKTRGLSGTVQRAKEKIYRKTKNTILGEVYEKLFTPLPPRKKSDRKYV